MCLYLKQNSQLYTASIDITVYKFLTNTGAGLVSPYYNYPVKIGETYTSDLIKVYSNSDGFCCNVGIHSYKKKVDAEKMSYINNRFQNIIVKCIIPKGARYFKGLHVGEVSYASDTLTYVEIYEL